MRLLGPLVSEVFEVVSEMTGYPVDHLTATRGPQRIQKARKIGFWVARQFGATNLEIARATNRTHWTVQTAYEGVECDSSLKALAMEVAEEVHRRYGGRRQAADASVLDALRNGS